MSNEYAVVKLRKVFIVFFGGLCAIFVAFAMYRQIPIEQREKPPENYNWGRNIEARARFADKLVFVHSPDMKLPDDVLKKFSENYVCGVLDAERWPADAAVFESVLNGKFFKFGILTPKLVPLFLSSSEKIVMDGAEIPMEKVIAQTARSFFSHKSAAYNAATTVLNSVFLQRTEPTGQKMLHDVSNYTEFFRLYSFFNSDDSENRPAAELAETARLALRLYKKIPNPMLQHALIKANNNLINRISKDGETLAERLVIARALAEFAEFKGSAELKNALSKFMEELTTMETDAGLFAKKDRPPTVAANALAVGVLLRASSVCGNATYLKSAVKTANALEYILRHTPEMPAVAGFDIDSQSSSYEYALVSKAFVEIYKAVGNEKFLDDAIFAFDEWDKNFMTKSGVWSVNSHNSPTGGMVRLVQTADKKLPSYIGEGLQAILETADIDANFDISKYKRAMSFAQSYKFVYLLSEKIYASIRLCDFR